MRFATFVHLGDFHAAPGSRNADRYRALDQIINDVLNGPTRSRLSAWLWPGDLFDAESSTEDRNALDARLRRMAAVAPVVICYGNHDRSGDLDGFANLRAEWPIVVIAKPGCVRVPLASGGHATIFVLPYPQKAMLTAAGIAVGHVVDTAGDLLEPLFMLAAHQLETARVAGDFTLMVGHINVAGARASTGQPNVGREIEMSPRHLDRLGHIYKGLNHIHAPQEIAGAHYAGSICRLSYGETEEKRYLVVELSDDGIIGRYSYPIDVSPMFLVEGRLTREGFEAPTSAYQIGAVGDPGDVEIHRRMLARDWAGADVRVRYRYKVSERAVLDPAVIAPLFAGALRLKVESIADPDRDVRSPEVAAAKTLSAKLAAFRKVDTLDPSLAHKLEQLESMPDSTALLVDVATQLKTIEFPSTPAPAMVAA